MRISLLLIISSFLSVSCYAQDTIQLYSDAIAKQKSLLRPSVGIDLFQAVWFINSASLHDSPATYVRPISATLYLPDKRLDQWGRAMYINVGYVDYGGTLQRNIYQKGGSAHVRVGIEHTRQSLIYGYGGLLSGWSGQGSFLFTGNTFGTYQESIGNRNGLAVGIEGHLGAAIPFSDRLSLRTTLRTSVLAKMGNMNNLQAPHLSGIDWQGEKQTSMGFSIQVNLVFRL